MNCFGCNWKGKRVGKAISTFFKSALRNAGFEILATFGLQPSLNEESYLIGGSVESSMELLTGGNQYQLNRGTTIYWDHRGPFIHGW